jgi:hypothetical protein
MAISDANQQILNDRCMAELCKRSANNENAEMLDEQLLTLYRHCADDIRICGKYAKFT